MGGKRAYKSSHGKDRSPRQKPAFLGMMTLVEGGLSAQPPGGASARSSSQARSKLHRPKSKSCPMSPGFLLVHADAHAGIGFGKILIGRAEGAEAHIVEALRLRPRDTFRLRLDDSRGYREAQLGDCEQAVGWFRRATEVNRNFPLAIG